MFDFLANLAGLPFRRYRRHRRQILKPHRFKDEDARTHAFLRLKYRDTYRVGRKRYSIGLKRQLDFEGFII